MQGAQARREYLIGLLLVAGSAVAWSTAGFYSRALGVDVWTTLFWRCAFAGLLLASWCAYSTGFRFMTELRALGGPGLMVAACIAVGTMSFIAALDLTSVADVLIIQATAPFVAAFLGWAWLKERLDAPRRCCCGLPI
jgi:drug/metabolite transporter (DMT)-like permease